MKMRNSKAALQKPCRGIIESFPQLTGKLSDAVQRHIKGTEIQEHLIRQVALEIANKNCQKILCPIREREDLHWTPRLMFSSHNLWTLGSCGSHNPGWSPGSPAAQFPCTGRWRYGGGYL